MFDIDVYTNALSEKLQKAFADRLIYVGLQGSHMRGEATDNSDIDIMLIIDALTVDDMDEYREILKSMGHYDRSCGFICGREEFEHWNPLELCHVLHTAKDVYGKLNDIIPEYTDEDVKNFIKLSVGNLYHELCHRYIHRGPERSAEKLPLTYRSVFFILQNLYYLESGVFAQTKAELTSRLAGQNKRIMESMMKLGAGEQFDFENEFSMLLDWCKDTMRCL